MPLYHHIAYSGYQFAVSSCQGEYSSGYDDKSLPTPEDVKPSYLVNYGPVGATPNDTGDTKPEYNPYFDKPHAKADPMKVPKTEISTNSCCNMPPRRDVLVPKTEANTCRSPSSSMRPAYDPYMNQDSNSSSISSAENTSRIPPHGQMHHSLLPHHGQQPGYVIEDGRQSQMAHRSPYHQSSMSEEMYHR